MLLFGHENNDQDEKGEIMKKRVLQSWIAVASITTALLSNAVFAADAATPETPAQVTTPCNGYLEIEQVGQKQLSFQGNVSAGETIPLETSDADAIYTATLKGNDGVLYYGNGTDAITLDAVSTWEEEERTTNAATIQFEVESNNSIKKANTLTGNTIYGTLQRNCLLRTWIISRFRLQHQEIMHLF